MANLPEKNITQVDKITSIPSNSNLFLNADGEFRQASVNDVIKSATVVSDTVNNAINDAMQDSIDSHFKQATGSPILLTDTADGTLIDFKGKGRSTQNGTPTPDSPIAIKSVADSGYFDGELLSGMYKGADGTYINNANYVCSKNMIPCAENDVIKLIYGKSVIQLVLLFYDENKNYIDFATLGSAKELSATAPINAKYFHFDIHDSNLTLQTAKPITVTINGKYALIVKSVSKNLLDYSRIKTTSANGATLTNNNDGSFTISGSGILSNAFNTYFDYSHKETVRLLKVGELKLDINGVATTPYLYIQLRSGTNAYLQISSSDDVKTKNVTQAMLDDENVYLRIGFYGASTGVSIVGGTMKPMLYQYGDSDFVAHKTHTSYIPLSAPLRSNLDGSVTDEISLSENKVTRRIVRKRIVTVSKNNSTDVNNYCYYCVLGNVGRSNRGMSNNLPNLSLYEVSINGTENIGQYVSVEYRGVVYINVGKHLTENTVEGMTKWLSENPTYIQYELAEPIVETIEPVDIVTYDNVTYLTASDNAEMELEYPTSKVAGIASIGYSKGRKAEYEVELLKAQLLELQTAMVNSL